MVDSKILHRGKFVEFRIDTIERADGSRAERDWAGHPGAVAIVALDADGRVALVRQWRLAADDALLEIPAGGLDIVDGSKEDPEIASRRELEEETGLRAGTWRKLGEFYSAPGFTDELMHLYLATDLSPADPDGRLGPDEDERLILEWRPWQEAVAAVERGEIRDAKSVAGLFWLARVLGEGAVDGRGAAVGGAALPGAAAAGGSDAVAAGGGEAAGGSNAVAAGDSESATVGAVAQATYRMTMGEIVRSTVLVTRRSWFIRVIGILMVASASLGIAVGDLVSVGFFALGVSFVTGWFAAPFAWFQARKRPDLVGAEWRLTADERGLRVASPMLNGLTLWSTFRVLRETGEFFFLDTGSGMHMVIPKRAFAPADLATFYRLLDGNGLLKG